MADHAQAVVKAVVAAAKDGDMTAARLVLDRIAPPCRGRPVRLNLPPIVSAADLVRALAARISKTGTCNTTNTAKGRKAAFAWRPGAVPFSRASVKGRRKWTLKTFWPRWKGGVRPGP